MRTIMKDKHSVLPEKGKVCSRFRNMKSQHLNDSHALEEHVTKSVEVQALHGFHIYVHIYETRNKSQQDFVRMTI